jgi:hypothetical protein
MKKLVLAISVFAIAVTTPLFAQEAAAAKVPAAKTPAKGNSALSFDIVPLVISELLLDEKAGIGVGVNYEKLYKSGFSIGARLDLVLVDKQTYFGIDAHGRWYPLGASLEKLFLDAGLGYGRLSYDGTKFVDGLTFALKAGWKLPLSPKLFVEPTMGYTIAKGTGGYGPSGLGIGFSLGKIL